MENPARTGLFLALTLFISASAAQAADDSDPNIGQGALVGASTTVMGDAAVDTISSPQAKQQPWYTTLKRALTGAATGAVAAKTSGGSGEGSDAENKSVDSDAATAASSAASAAEKGEHKHKHKKGKGHGRGPDGHRPPGWDKGKKTGWGDGDVPPGLRDKDHKHKD